MNETKDKHTPGPWETGALMTRVEVLLNGWNAPMCIADCHAKNAPESEAERVANAKLIAAAPAMLAALEAIHAILNQPVQFSGERTSTDVLRLDAGYAREMALAAIAQARGEA